MTVRNSATSSIAALLALAGTSRSFSRRMFLGLGDHIAQCLLSVELTARKYAQKRNDEKRVGKGKGEIIDHVQVFPVRL